MKVAFLILESLRETLFYEWASRRGGRLAESSSRESISGALSVELHTQDLASYDEIIAVVDGAIALDPHIGAVL